ncbi:MAG: SPFH domain-containing protein [Phycisphaerales bacterium]
MRADYLSYQRATGVSFLGMAIQAIVAAALVIYAALMRDSEAMTVGLFAAIGILAWFALGIVFDQARRERIEAIEVETLGQDAASASVFESSGDDFKVAARRLRAMYRIFFPIMSVLIGASLITLGWFRYQFGWANHDAPIVMVARGWAMGIEIGAAVAMFLLARYAGGMARQSVWANLRAGGAMAAGVSLMCIALVAGHITDIVGPDAPLRFLRFLIPAAMIVLGVEVFLNFLLEVYRPRKAGDIPNPAFNSRLLGFFAAPEAVAKSINEAINYQLGYDVSSTWLYRLLSRAVVPLVLGGLLVMWALSCFTVILPYQRAMVLRFGRPVMNDVGPGLLIKWPWPIDQVVIPVEILRNEQGERIGTAETTTGLRELSLATQAPTGAGAILWTNDHAREEVYQLVRPSGTNGLPTIDSAGSARDLSVLSLEIPLVYSISNVELFEEFGAPSVRDELLRATAQREIMRYMATLSVDDLLGPKRVSVNRDLTDRIEAAFARLNPGADGKGRGPGIQIIRLGVAGVHPPKKVASDFEAVVGAEQNRQAKIDKAKADAIKTLTEIVGSVSLSDQIILNFDSLDRLRTENVGVKVINEKEFEIQKLLDQAGGAAAGFIAEAKADRWRRHMGERARAERYAGQLASFLAAPEIFKASLYFDALKIVMADSRVYITSDKIPDLRVTTQLFDRQSGTNVFQEIKQDDIPN